MPTRTIKIATRKSPLALWQSHYIKGLIESVEPTAAVELIGITTEGDIKLGTSLAKIGGKGLFIKELEKALLEGSADIAVHSMKDMTVNVPEGLTLAAFSPRADVRDAFVSNHFNSIADLPIGAKVGTSSIRRQSQLLALRPDVSVIPLRGNVNTRLAKLDAGEFDAILLAAAGLLRLDLSHRITQFIETSDILPAVAQAIVGVECRSNDTELLTILQKIDCPTARCCIMAERAMNRALGGSCLAPIAALATPVQQQLHLIGRVMDSRGTRILEEHAYGDLQEPERLGEQVAKQLLQAGAGPLLKEFEH